VDLVPRKAAAGPAGAGSRSGPTGCQRYVYDQLYVAPTWVDKNCPTLGGSSGPAHKVELVVEGMESQRSGRLPSKMRLIGRRAGSLTFSDTSLSRPLSNGKWGVAILALI
jgi:hypothetical protein